MSPTKLTPEQQAEIRRLYASTAELPAIRRVVEANPERWSLAKLGDRFGVSRETIRRILAKTDNTEETTHAH
jgi:AraC-like DNA-binding protein